MSLTQADLDFHTSRKVKLHQSIHGLLRGLDDIQESLVGANFVLVPGILVDMRGSQDSELLLLGRQWDGTPDLSARSTGRLYNLLGRGVDQTVIKSLETNTNCLLYTSPSPRD